MTDNHTPIKSLGLARRYRDALIEDGVALTAGDRDNSVGQPMRAFRYGPWRVVLTNGEGTGHAPISSPPLGIVCESDSKFVPWHAVVSLVGPIMLTPREYEEG